MPPGLRLRTVQSGNLRQYVMWIAVGTVALFLLISFYWNWAWAGSHEFWPSSGNCNSRFANMYRTTYSTCSSIPRPDRVDEPDHLPADRGRHRAPVLPQGAGRNDEAVFLGHDDHRLCAHGLDRDARRPEPRPIRSVFRSARTDMQYEVSRPWIPAFDINYHLGLDGISLPLVVLTSFLSMLAMWASWPIQKHVRAYCILFLLLETGMLGVFMSLDFFLFYVFWEVMLLPMYFLIGVWGGPRREYAAIKFFLFTLVGSVLMLIALLMLYFTSDVHAPIPAWLHSTPSTSSSRAEIGAVARTRPSAQTPVPRPHASAGGPSCCCSSAS